MIPVEHFLIFQNDVVARKPDNLDMFINYDYVGAPWSWCEVENSYCWLAGNGGVSLRKKSSMLQFVTEFECGRWSCSVTDIYQFHQNSTLRGPYLSEEDTWLAYRMF